MYDDDVVDAVVVQSPEDREAESWLTKGSSLSTDPYPNPANPPL
jgi:hypothetical protein